MSYFDYPRLHFSGGYKASPSTINNTPNNFDPEYYPSPNELRDVELYWNPKGDGGFRFENCVVTRVDYGPGAAAHEKRTGVALGGSGGSCRCFFQRGFC